MIMDSTPAEISGTALALRGSARSSQVAGGSARYVLPRVPFRTKSLNLPLRLAAGRRKHNDRLARASSVDCGRQHHDGRMQWPNAH